MSGFPLPARRGEAPVPHREIFGGNRLGFFLTGNFPTCIGNAVSRELLTMAERKLGQEVISRVVKKLGSIELAAARLGIRAGLVQRFVDGLSAVPDAVLLKALDLVADPNSPVQALQPKSKPPKGRPVI